MTCEECPLREGCIEQRGLCRDYILYMERVERIRNQIEGLNENKEKVTGRSGTDQSGVQKAGDRRGKVYQSPAERLQTKAGTDPKEGSEAEAEKEAGQRIQT